MINNKLKRDLGYLYDYTTIQKSNISNLPRIISPEKIKRLVKVDIDKSDFFKCSVNRSNHFLDSPKKDFSKTMNFFNKSKLNLNNLK